MTCTKVNHITEADAKAYAEISHEGYARAYDCPHCPFWHLTTKQPRRDIESKIDWKNFIPPGHGPVT